MHCHQLHNVVQYYVIQSYKKQFCYYYFPVLGSKLLGLKIVDAVDFALTEEIFAVLAVGEEEGMFDF